MRLSKIASGWYSVTYAGYTLRILHTYRGYSIRTTLNAEVAIDRMPTLREAWYTAYHLLRAKEFYGCGIQTLKDS